MKTIFLLVLILLLSLWSCAPKEPAHEMPEKSLVAVAGFSQPMHRDFSFLMKGSNP